MSKLLTIAFAMAPSISMADKLPPLVAGMDCLVGTWHGAGSLTIGKDKAKIDAAWTCKRTPGDFGVICNLHVTGMPGGGTYEETDLMGYEPNTNTFHWFAVTNAGETHDHVAKANDGNKQQFVYTGTQDAKPFREVIDMEFSKDSKSIVGKAETFVGGQSTSVLALELHK
jgi:hypothetical protein